jgi:probable HAF family extracellular repeat protein
VLPAASYTPSVYKPTGGFRDVNGKNLIVGTAGGSAVAMVLGSPMTVLHNGGGIASRAEAVNNRSAIVGAVDFGSPQQPFEVPAYWRRVGLPPITLGKWGEARDINDLGLVVGTLWTPQGYGEAFVWNPTTGSVDLLPAIPSGFNTSAYAINNDNVILGWSDGWTVLWQHNGISWGVWQVQSATQGIAGADIDAGYGIVGHTMYTASFGDPAHAGYFSMSSLGRSFATAVTGRGMATGWDEGVTPPGVPHAYGFGTSFIADRSGATTYLPYPVGPWLYSAGHGLNDCGLVVGEIWRNSAWYPAVWDPGC